MPVKVISPITLVIVILSAISSSLPAVADHHVEHKDVNDLTPSSPLYRDPVFAGAADPTVFYNHKEKQWWMLYTQRRANADNTYKLSWVHGTQIGVASSPDNGRNWKYRGTLPLSLEPGHNTYWAPEMFFEGGEYHMFVSFVQGIPVHDYMDEHKIAYLKGKNPWAMKFVGYADLDSNRVIDPSVIKLKDGTWRMWFKAENAGYVTHYADSKNLKTWTRKGPAIGDKKCEGANIFYWQDKYWMVVDPWEGLALYSSTNATDWVFERNLLRGKGQRKEDSGKGHHPGVVVQGEYAFIFYHTNPQEEFVPEMDWEKIKFPQRRSLIQVARMRLVDNKVVVDRDTPFALDLSFQSDPKRY